jgi:hypothetical protein
MPKESADDRILMLDESVGVGQEKLMVIPGIRRSKLPSDRALTLQDMSPLTVKSRTQWTCEAIINIISNWGIKMLEVLKKNILTEEDAQELLG